MQNTDKIVIFGTGEIAELAYYYFTDDSPYEVVAFVADDEFIDSDNFLGLPLIKFSQIEKYYPPTEYGAHVALSYRKLNRIREQKYYEMKDKGYRLVSYVSSNLVNLKRGVSIGDNCFILENQTIQHNVKIGNNVVLWSGNHIGHGSSIGDHTYISSHVVVSGHCTIGKRCFIGVNATLKDFIKVGDDVFITMGALVTRDIPDGSVVLTESSKILKSDDKLAIRLKKMYFSL
ncbi:sugar O-acyltransferase, sialic acid O-acetyltransferase NeuD family [Persephonella hydrogeniphila]|uniref:Sugar O-acyltransferase, sialic acid O-acetyltransferase NeuD family n=1 Tax=Persephonella hydrogeniphila TaxID=198703 RepID=A0A285N2U8_9AQUI|nr:acetyltransferase [Persephonella hydrogeniphila]SNZ03772.1 sugar O-acyltransferase, sialic acid O-acetyltransferase NeuD family [Persephonella hydrogeniphila]